MRSAGSRRGCASARWNRVDGLLEALAADEPHGIVGPALVVGPQAVDRDDARVLQPAGDLGLEQEAGAAGGVVGVLGLDLLESKPNRWGPYPVGFERLRQLFTEAGVERVEKLATRPSLFGGTMYSALVERSSLTRDS